MSQELPTITGVDQNETTAAPSRAEYRQRAERKRLTKADIVNGTGATRDHYVQPWGGYVTIRPLSECEWQEIRQLTMRGVRQIATIDPDTQKPTGSEMEVDYSEQQAGSIEADRLTVAYGLSVGSETWTSDEVKDLRPASIVEELAREILKLSGIRLPKSKQSADDDAEADASTANREEEEASLESEVDAFHTDT